jgi:hypothetical protein
MTKGRFSDERIVGFVNRPELADAEAVGPEEA